MSATPTLVTVDKSTERRLRTAAGAVERATSRRNEQIERVFLDGASYREIARATGLAHTAIKYIVEKSGDPAVVQRVSILRSKRSRPYKPGRTPAPLDISGLRSRSRPDSASDAGPPGAKSTDSH